MYFNGDLVPADRACVDISDGGFLHGAGLFETMRAETRRVFRLAAHYDRLRRSADKLLTPLPDKALPEPETLAELMKRNSLDTARIRLTVTAGPLRADSDAESALTVLATATTLSAYPEHLYGQGASVIVSSFRTSPTDPVAGHKTTSYFPRLLGLREAQQARCMEALWFTTTKHLAEGCISNVFVVRNGVIRTPPLDTPILPGTARAVVLELSDGLAIKTEQTPLGIDDLLDADEVFLTNAIMQVMPVIRIEKKDIGSGRVGEISRRLLVEYRRLVNQECRE